MRCQNCSTENPESGNYCGHCGVPLAGKEITLRDLIEAGYLKAGDAITCKVKGQDVDSTLLSDGRIQHGGQSYDNPFQAMTAIRGYPCDSWTCWKGRSGEGESKPLAHFRTVLLKGRRG